MDKCSDTGDGAALRPSVLVADDNSAVRRAVVHALSPSYDVVTARSGMEAVKVCHERQPDVALVDVVMPEGGGFDVLAQVREFARPPKVVFFTATQDCRQAAQAIQLGASEYLVKPCPTDRIRQAIEAALANAPV